MAFFKFLQIDVCLVYVTLYINISISLDSMFSLDETLISLEPTYLISGLKFLHYLLVALVRIQHLFLACVE